MRPQTLLPFLPLLLSPITAQSTTTIVTLLMPFVRPDNATATLLSAGSTATAYEIHCPTYTSTSAAYSNSTIPTPIPTSTSHSHSHTRHHTTATSVTSIPSISSSTSQLLRRQQSSSSPTVWVTCPPPFTVTQGPSTYEMHLTDSPSLTVSANCVFGTAGLQGPATCVESLGGLLAATTHSYPVTNTFPGWPASVLVPVTVVAALGTGTATSPTTTGEGAAHVVGRPTGAVAFVGAGAGVLVAALAL